MRAILPLIIVFSITRAVDAVNIAFVPGDAFFPSILTTVDLERFEQDGLILKYRYPPSMVFSFCGYSGFQKLHITGNTDKLIENLQRCYQVNRETFRKELIEESDGTLRETNGLLLLVYNKNVDWQSTRLRLGIKYNENWNNYPDDAFTKVPRRLKNKAYIYNTFVKTADAVIHDWQYAEKFSGINVNVPPGTGWGYPGPQIDVPVTIDADAVQIVVLSFDNTEKLFRQRYRQDFDVVNSEGYFRYTYFKNKSLKGADTFQQTWNESNGWMPEDVPGF